MSTEQELKELSAEALTLMAKGNSYVDPEGARHIICAVPGKKPHTEEILSLGVYRPAPGTNLYKFILDQLRVLYPDREFERIAYCDHYVSLTPHVINLVNLPYSKLVRAASGVSMFQ
jgi:hypothetical protein